LKLIRAVLQHIQSSIASKDLNTGKPELFYMYDVICVGSATVDAFASTKTDLVRIYTPHIKEVLIAYPAGTKVLMTTLNFTVGGGGTNSAVSMARMGLKTAYLGKVGKGTNSAFILSLLKKEKVDTRFTIKGKNHSGYSVILDAKGRDRTVLAYKGSNNDLKVSELKLSQLKTKWFYFASMVGESYKTQIQLAKFAVSKKIKIAYNPSSYLTRKGASFLKPLLSRTHLLVLNKEEACNLVGEGTKNELLTRLMALGPQEVIVTDGNKGAFTCFDGVCYEIKPRGIKVVDATGAGDAFASTFVGARIKGKNISDALHLANVNAESVIQDYGAKNRLLSWKELLQGLRKIKYKMIRKRI